MLLSLDNAAVGKIGAYADTKVILRVKNYGEEEASVEGGGLNSVGPFQVIFFSKLLELLQLLQLLQLLYTGISEGTNTCMKSSLRRLQHTLTLH